MAAAGPARAATLTWGTSGTGGSANWSDANIWSGVTWNNANNDDAWFSGTPGTVTLTTSAPARCSRRVALCGMRVASRGG